MPNSPIQWWTLYSQLSVNKALNYIQAHADMGYISPRINCHTPLLLCAKYEGKIYHSDQGPYTSSSTFRNKVLSRRL